MRATLIQLPFPVADPYLLAADGRYYLYGTSEDGETFACRSSEDLRTWREEGAVYRRPQNGWCVDCFWAPECYHFDGKYYLFYSANWRHNPLGEEETFRIGAAVADRPTGPFVDLSDRPIFDPGYPIIDANVYEEQGRFYLYYSRCCYKHPVGDCEESWIYGVELRPDFTGVLGEPVLLLRPEQPWENRSAAQTGRRWNEGSFVWKHAGRYYMTYSANFFGGEDYAVGYATADAPLGPYRKAECNPILEKNALLTGTGHSCMAERGDGRYWMAFHGRTRATGMARMGFIAEAAIGPDGRLTVDARAQADAEGLS